MKDQITTEHVCQKVREILDGTGHGRLIVYISDHKITALEPRVYLKAVDLVKKTP